ncbi:MAG: hypothetical protein ACREN8_12115 [Candidatus Dormibacteraceae bacterium]
MKLDTVLDVEKGDLVQAKYFFVDSISVEFLSSDEENPLTLTGPTPMVQRLLEEALSACLQAVPGGPAVRGSGGADE